MINIPIQAIPNQSLSIQLNTVNYNIVLRDCGNVMAMDLSINNELIISGQRLVPSFPAIPYAYLENGNFVFVTPGEDGFLIPGIVYPYWDKFNVDQFLVYASQEELETFTAEQLAAQVINAPVP